MISLCFLRNLFLKIKNVLIGLFAKGSKLLGLVPEPNIAPYATYKTLSTTNEKAEVISG